MEKAGPGVKSCEPELARIKTLFEEEQNVKCSNCGTESPEDAQYCTQCGAQLHEGSTPATEGTSPQTSSQPSPGDDVVATIIPYRNVPALVSWYTGVFSLIPCVGLLLALVAVPTGIAGLVIARKKEGAHGTLHGIAGILLGIVSIIYHILGILWWPRPPGV